MQLPNSPPSVLPHMPNLIRFLSKVLFDPNFTICLTSIRLIGELLPKLQSHIKPTLSFFLPSLFEVFLDLMAVFAYVLQKFGDSKIIIRQETMKVVNRTMQLVPPSNVIDVIKACYDEKTPSIFAAPLLLFPSLIHHIYTTTPAHCGYQILPFL